ncbi:hypothetical protein TWF281_004796 [Arthrobotrys megalospora]
MIVMEALILLFLLVGSPPLVYALNCSANPITLRFGNVTLGKDPSRPQAFGVPFILGGQYFAAAINPFSPSAFVQSIAKNCANVKNIPADCPDNGHREVEVGGFFAGELSNTYTGPSYPNLPVVSETDELNTTVKTFDVLDLGEGGAGPYIGNSTFFTHQQDYYRLGNVRSWPASIGLGNQSNILNHLRDTNVIASKSWSFFGGWHGITAESAQDGQLVLGGYDKSKIDGDFVNFPMSDSRDDIASGCVLIARVKGLTISHSGRDFNVYQDHIGYRSCIDPTKSTLTLLAEPFNRVMGALGQGNLSLYEQILPPGSNTLEDWVEVNRDNKTLSRILEETTLTLQFQGINITIPGAQFSTLNKKSTPSGWELAPDSKNTTWILADDGLGRARYGPYHTLGLPFLSAAVLMVNHENSTFSLAQAAKEKTDKKKSELVPIKSERCNPSPVTPQRPDDSEIGDPDPVNPDTPTSTEEPSPSSRGLEKGEIVGIAIGVLSAILIACIGIFLLYRRRKNQSRLLFPPSPPNTKGYHEKDGQELFEMPGDQTFGEVSRPRRAFFRRTMTLITR